MASQESTSTALVRKRTDTDLMPPPPPSKRIKRPKKVLDEDTYTEALSRIIARDFFPGLLESETQHEYLDALESKDQAWISSAGRRLQQVMTPGRQRSRTPARQPVGHTPIGYSGDTPSSTISVFPVADEKPSIDMNLSLSAFQATYTSEDNESFYKLLDKQNQKRAEKYAWLWTGNKLPSKQQLKQKEIELRRAQTRGITGQDDTAHPLAILSSDDRPAVPDTWTADPKNALMFKPDGVDDSLETVAQRAQAQSRMAPKSIAYENTRVPVPYKKPDESVPPSPSLSAVRDAISGRPRSVYQDSTTGGNETPRVNGYAFVDDEEPEEPPPAAPQIDLGPGNATPNPFKLQESSKREDLHHRMVERIAQNKRTSAKFGLTGKPEKTPVPRFPSSPRVTGGLTPAAQRLWSKIDSAGRSGSATPFHGKATPLRGKSSGLKIVTKRTE